MIIADAAASYFVWTAFQALLPVAAVAFGVGLGLAWIVWGFFGKGSK